MLSKDADGMANSVDPGQTAPFKEQSDLGLHCLLTTLSVPLLSVSALFAEACLSHYLDYLWYEDYS